MTDAEVLTQVLPALAHDGGEPGQRAWAALAGMTTRVCGRYSAEGRAIEAARAAGGSDPAVLRRLAGLLTQRAFSDARFASGFASGFVPWLAAARMLLPGLAGDR